MVIKQVFIKYSVYFAFFFIVAGVVFIWQSQDTHADVASSTGVGSDGVGGEGVVGGGSCGNVTGGTNNIQ